MLSSGNGSVRAVAEKRRGGRKATGMTSPGRGSAEDAAHRKEIGEFVEPLDQGVNRAGIVPAGGGPNDRDDRRRMFLGKQRLGKRWTEVITNVEAGVFTWDEFVATLDASEISRGQLKDKDGKFRGRPPAFVPRGFYDACTKELLKRGRSEWEKAYLGALEAMTKIATKEGAKDADRIKAAQIVIERIEGKTPDKVEIKMSDPFSDLVEGAIAQISEDAAIANAQDYFERMDRDV